MKTTMILLGGVPGIGKTTLAYQLALYFHVDKVISLDILKEATKEYIPFKDCPYLYTTTHEAYQIESLDPIHGFKKHCQTIQDFLDPLLAKMTDERAIIVEGAQLTPDFLGHIDLEKFTPIYFNLYSHSANTLLNRYEMKNKIRTYHWAENIETIIQMQKYLLTFSKVNHCSIDRPLLFERISEKIKPYMEET